MEEMGGSPLQVRRLQTEATLCRLLITLAEETFYMKNSWVNLGKQIWNLRNEYAEGESSKRQVQQKKKILQPIYDPDIKHDEEKLVGARI